MMNTDIVARLFCAAFTLYAPFTALTAPTSVAARSARFQFENGVVLFVLMSAIAILIIVDVLANDLLGDKFEWVWISKKRDWLYLGSAFCAAVVPFSVNRYAELSAGAIYLYVFIFLGSLSLAWCDAYAQNRCGRRKTDKREATT